MGYARAPGGGCFLHSGFLPWIAQPYAKLTSCMDIQYCINYCAKPYTKLAPNLHEAYTKLTVTSCYKTYTKLTEPA